MKKFIAIIMTVFMMIGLAAYSAVDNTEQQNEITDVAVYEDTQADILTADFYDLEDGNLCRRWEYTTLLFDRTALSG